MKYIKLIMHSFTYLFFSLFVCMALAENTAMIPIMMWSNDNLKQFDRQQLENSVNSYDYKNLLTNDPDVTVLFLQKELGVEDFSKYGNVYANQKSSNNPLASLKNIMKEQKGIQYFHQGTLDIAKLSAKLGLKEKYLEHSKNLPTMTGKKLFFVIKLPTDNDRFEELQKSNNIINKFNEQLKKSGLKYLVIYTSSKRPFIDTYYSTYDLDFENVRSRQLLSYDISSNGTYVNVSNCVLFYAKTISFNLNKMSKEKKRSSVFSYTLPNDPDSSGSSCENSSSPTLELKWNSASLQDSTNMSELTLKFGFSYSLSIGSKTWKVSSITGSYTTTNVTKTSTSWSHDGLMAPLNYCYYCHGGNAKTDGTTTGSDLRMREITKSSTEYYFSAITYSELQIEAYNTSTAFSSSSTSCNDVMSIAILSGLLISFMLIVILMFGIAMISVISTPDRFDDPRGKTITIVTNEITN